MGIESINSFTLMTSDYVFEDPEVVVQKQQYTPWKELQDIERRRRKILKRSELPFWRILGYFEGTCLKAMVVDWLLWVTLGVYVSLRVVLRLGLGGEALHLVDLGLGDTTDISVIGGFLSFFLVLFVNQSNTRFTDMYKTSMKCPARIYDVAQIVAPTFSKARAQRLIRRLNAAHVAGYVGLSRTYCKVEFFDKLNEAHQFLTTDELKRVAALDMDHGPDAFHELVGWCMKDIETAFAKNEIDAREKSALKDKTTQFRNSMDDLYDYTDQPIHFFYIHFLCLLSTVYLPLFAADNAFNAGSGEVVHWSWDILSGLIVLVQAIFVIGLRLLGQKMADPFGDDLEDLSVMHYVTEAWKQSQKMLASESPAEEDASLETEQELAKKRKASLGKGFSGNAVTKAPSVCTTEEASQEVGLSEEIP